MRQHWKLIAFEIILEIVLEIGPVSFSMMAAVAQYLVALSQGDSRNSVQLIVRAIESNSDRTEHTIDLLQQACMLTNSQGT
jgi:replication-associated recombination protein RarA